MRTALIVSSSPRDGLEEGPFRVQPLIKQIYSRVFGLVDEMVVVAFNETQREKILQKLGDVKVVLSSENQTATGNLVAGFEAAEGEISLVTQVDKKALSLECMKILLEACVNRDAVIVRSPDGTIEPLKAAYNTQRALDACRLSLETGKPFPSTVSRLKNVLYLSTIAIREIDIAHESLVRAKRRKVE